MGSDADTGHAGSAADAGRWVVGAAEFNDRTLELTVNGRPVAVERLPLELLRLLLRHPGEVLEKAALHAHLWPGRVVSESVLPRCVAKLRRALDDGDQTLIRTVHGYGYRLVAPVTRVEGGVARSPSAGEAPPLRPRWRLLRSIEGNAALWLAAQVDTGEQRLYCFADSAEALRALRDSIDLTGRWKAPFQGDGERHRVLDCNAEQAPFYLELECLPTSGVGTTAPSAGAAGRLARVFLIEDQEDTRARLASAVTAAADLELVGAVGSCAAALAALVEIDADVVLVDLGLPDGSGTDLIRQLRGMRPQTLFMVITVFGDERHVVEAIEAGAVAYLLKDTTASGVARSIRTLCQGGSPISPAVARFLLQRPTAQPAARPFASTRESDILQWVAQGYTEPEIAQRTGQSVDDIRRQIRDIYGRLAAVAQRPPDAGAPP